MENLKCDFAKQRFDYVFKTNFLFLFSKCN